MGLFEDIEAILKTNGGQLSVEEIIGSLNNKYAKDTIIDFFKANRSDFLIKGTSITSYRYPVDYLRFLLDGFLQKTQMDGDIVFYTIAYFLFLRRQFPKIEIQDYKDAIDDVEMCGYIKFTEPDFWKFSDNDLRMLIELFSNYCNKISIDSFTVDQFYKFVSEYYEYFINTSALTRGSFSSPNTLIQLICKLVPNNSYLKVYNPAAGILKLLSAINLKLGRNTSIKASEIDKMTFRIGALFAATNGLSPDFTNEDSINELEHLGSQYFDLIVSVPPFKAKPYPRYDDHKSYKDVALDIISSSLNKLKEGGKAIFLVVDGVLFSETKNHKRFRREIIDSRMLHSVISLPVNLFYPFTSVKTSLLIFEKNRAQSLVHFIDAAGKAFYSTTREKTISLDVEKISALYESKESHLSVANSDMKLNAKTILGVEYGELKKNEYSLSIQKYLMNDALKDQDMGSVELGRILTKSQPPLNSDMALPYIRITDLNGSYIENPDAFPINQTRTRGRLLTYNAILIGLVGGSSKPTFYKSDLVVEVSTNIAIFRPDEKQVDVNYLLQELNSAYIKDQFDFMAVGSTSLRHLKVSDLLKARIKLPPLSEQKRLANERMQFVKEHNISTETEVGGISTGQIIKTLKHEIGNIMAGPSGLLNLLPKFLAEQNVALDTPSANYGSARSIGDRISSASSDISKINQIMETMEGILLAESSAFVPENTELVSYLRKRFEKALEHKAFDYYIGVHNKYNSGKHINAEIDKAQFDHLVDNVITNAVEHSRTVNGKLMLLVNIVLVETDKSKDIEIHFMNNGDKLSGDFSIEDYIGFSKKSGSSQGQGIGGFLINRIGLNHNGKLNLLPPSVFKFESKDEVVNFNSNFELVVTIPKKQ